MRLDAEGFSWDPRSQKWEMSFKLLEQFRKRAGHCRVPQSLKVDGVNLGSWVNYLRMAKKKGQLTPERIKRLDALSFTWAD